MSEFYKKILDNNKKWVESKLELDSDYFKEEARNRFHTAKTLQDKRETQDNPGANSAKLVAAFNRLQERTSNIFSIMPNVFEDERLLAQIRGQIELQLFMIHQKLTNFILTDNYFKPFTKITAPRSYVTNNAQRINSQIQNDEHDTGVINSLKYLAVEPSVPAPFCGWAEAVLSNLRVVYKLNDMIAKKEVTSDQLQDVHNKIVEYMIRAELTLRYQNIQKVFVSILEDILERKIMPNSAKERLVQLRAEFDPPSSGQPFKLRKDLVFTDPVFAEMSVYLKTVIDLINEFGNESRVKNELKKEQVIDEIKADDYLKRGDEEYKKYQDILDKIYILLKECNFENIINSMTVNYKVEVEKIKKSIV